MTIETGAWSEFGVSVAAHPCTPMRDFDPVQKFESDMGCTKTYVYYLVLSYVLEIFEPLTFSVAAACSD